MDQRRRKLRNNIGIAACIERKLMNNPTSKSITVAIPIYNSEKYIARCLDSVLAQTFRDFEILCIDDCGNDCSMDVVREYALKYPDIVRVVASSENVGAGGARDKGIRYALGEYLMFIDGDDYILDPEYLNSFIQKAEMTSSDIVIGGLTIETNSGRKEYRGKEEDAYYKWFFVSPCAKLYRTDFLREHVVDFKGIRVYEDALFWYRCLFCHPKIEILCEAGYVYCLNPASFTKNRKQDRSGLFLEYLREADHCRKESTFSNGEQVIFEYCLLSAATVILLYNGKGCGKKKMDELYRHYDTYLKSLGGKAEKNRLIKAFSKRSEPYKNRMATFAVMSARRLHLDKALFALVSVL